MLHIDHIGFFYPNALEPVLTDVTFDVSDGEKVALVGDNGRGKTTLLRILTGDLTPTGGVVHTPAGGVRIGYLPQDIVLPPELSAHAACAASFADVAALQAELHAVETAMAHTAGDDLEALLERYSALQERFLKLGGYDLDARVSRALADVGLPEELHARPCGLLSGGEKTRVALAGLLLRSPELLLLDEPTNHLDLEMVLWLEDWLRATRLAVLFVSHDRVFIDNVADRVVSLERDGVHIRKGGWSDYRAGRDEEVAHQLAQWKERQDKLGQLRSAASKRRQWAGHFQKETRGEGGGFKYESITNAARTMTQQAKHIEERIKMLETRFPVEKPRLEKKRSFCFALAEPPGQLVFACRDVCKAFDGQVLFHELNLHVHKGERIHLAGRNGAGKTTLLRLWTGELTPDSGEVVRGGRLQVGLFDQEHRFLPRAEQALAWLLRCNDDETLVRTMMGCLGLEQEKVLQTIGTLSTGERARLALATLLVNRSNVLLLDEPTNHLDLRVREQLEDALEQFPGTLVFVSHDRWFIQRLATRVINLDAAVHDK